MMFKKTFINTICITLMITLLTVSVGRVTRVSAVATTATIAAAALLATGAVFVSYCALTSGSVHVPASSQINDWLTNIGQKVTQFVSGKSIYSRFYQDLLNPVVGINDLTMTLTDEVLKSLYNDFSDTRLIQDIVSYASNVELPATPTNGYAYSNFQFVDVPEVVGEQGLSFESYLGEGWYRVAYGATVLFGGSGNLVSIIPTNIMEPVRNRYTDGFYYPEVFRDGSWVSPGTVNVGIRYYNGSSFKTFLPAQNMEYYTFQGSLINSSVSGEHTYPPFPNAAIYDSETDTYDPVEVLEGDVVETPQWLNNYNPDDDGNRPIVPYVPLPFDPNVSDPSGGNGWWGFSIGGLLDSLEQLANGLMELGAISALINSFRNGITGSTFYIYYDDSSNGDTFYQYYQTENVTYYDDYSVTNYNIDVSQVDEHLPVDLNTISQYTNNTYIDTVKSSSQKGSTILRDFFVFWHDVDAEIVYVLFGCAIVTLVGAFIGKWGHS